MGKLVVNVHSFAVVQNKTKICFKTLNKYIKTVLLSYTASDVKVI